jgi:hypothetical protein
MESEVVMTLSIFQRWVKYLQKKATQQPAGSAWSSGARHLLYDAYHAGENNWFSGSQKNWFFGRDRRWYDRDR